MASGDWALPSAICWGGILSLLGHCALLQRVLSLPSLATISANLFLVTASRQVAHPHRGPAEQARQLSGFEPRATLLLKSSSQAHRPTVQLSHQTMNVQAFSASIGRSGANVKTCNWRRSEAKS